MTIHPAHAPFSVPPIQPIDDTLYVVTPISNPTRCHTRYRLYRAFAKHVQDSGAQLVTVECAFGARPFEITNEANPLHVQLRTNDELWHKENLLSIGISRLPADAKYIAVIDADFHFARPDWVQETIQQLQHHAAVQMFAHVHNQGPNGEPLGHNKSFANCWLSGGTLQFGSDKRRRDLVFGGGFVSYPGAGSGAVADWGSPGGAWAFRRSALDALGGLLDFAILGSGDWYMAAAMIGQLEPVLCKGYGAGYKAALLTWQERAQCLRQNIGFVEGSVFHAWHGKLAKRGYGVRDEIHCRCGFDPARDLKRDSQGLYQLHDDGTPRFIQLRDEIRAYFRSRNEDSIDV